MENEKLFKKNKRIVKKRSEIFEIQCSMQKCFIIAV